MELEIININGRKICVKGLGKLFYQHGFPIAMAIPIMKKEHNIEISIIHLADECIKNGWSGKTAYNKLKEEFFENSIESYTKEERDSLTNLLKQFCFAEYEEQRGIIFDYLFENEDSALEYGRTLFNNMEVINILEHITKSGYQLDEVLIDDTSGKDSVLIIVHEK